MASKQHATTEEQTAALGQIYRKPQQGDLLTGEYSIKRPRAGNGRHIQLHRAVSEPAKAPGMAYFPGTGPAGKYCKDCAHFGSFNARRGKRTVTVKDACEKAHEITGSVERGGIGANRSCKYFEPKPA